ncbi:pheromone autoinducer 2 transporter [Dermatophilus congolensis]|uniref:Pheromone autoinducer 2 transporter n=1 Tax=Dermatophilus congolensis TaxID=1863 RepID=A0AA46H146_9MICO|nr:AI-2E family transporter [Dermatophilus congolensis]STD12944.1 pheromone autoinducer 2 transporter [Dermatophilus congolensis]
MADETLGRKLRAGRARSGAAPAWVDVLREIPREGTHGGPVPRGLKIAAAWSWRLLLIGALVFVVVKTLSLVPLVTIPFVCALLLAAVLTPVQRWLHESLRVPHTLAAFLAVLIGVTSIGVVFTFVVGQIRSNAPVLADGFITFVNDAAWWAQHGPLKVDRAQVDRLSAELVALLSRNQEVLLSGALATLSTVGHLVAGGLLLLLSTFFMLRDGELLWGWVLSLLPARARRRADVVGRMGWHTLGGFMRGQTIIAFLHASTLFIVLILLDVPMALALSVLIFLGSYVPLVGMTVAGVLCVLVGLVEGGVGAAVVLALVIVVLVQLEAHLLQPLIMAHHVEVHPLAVAMAVLAGTSLGGIAGALFAVPLVAFANVTMRALAQTRSDEAGLVGEAGGVAERPTPAGERS